MKTLGIDLSTQRKQTAACLIGREGAEECKYSNPAGMTTSGAIGECDKCGIDMPLGWPLGFVKAVSAHALRKPWELTEMCLLTLRRTTIASCNRSGSAR